LAAASTRRCRRCTADWADVLAARRVPEHERRMLAAEPAAMHARRVEPDVVEFLLPSVDTQVRQLKAL